MASAPRVLGLDLATTCGWGYASGNKIQAWGVESFSVKNDSPHAAGLRLQKFWNWLAEWSGVDEIYYEEVHHGHHLGNDAAATYFGMLGILRMFVAGNRIPLIGMHTSTLKFDFVGEKENRSGPKGRVTKEDMCAQAHRLGWRGGEVGTAFDHDACDACALIVCIQRKRGNYVEFY